jgi:Tol biopolymer transport system component/DNA-binding winged helix-turn-helix (wHTH) protein
MPESSASRRIVRFAAFEFDAGTGELRKHGLRIKLQGQPIGVLLMLVDRAGEMVTREELQKGLWTDDTHVDFEHSLNAAIKRLRAALGDSADAPRFIETLPRQGYRFIAPLLDSKPTQTAVPQNEEPVAESLAEPPLHTAPAVGRSRRIKWIPLAAVVAAMSITVLVWFQQTEHFWRNPIAKAQFQTVTDFDEMVQAAAVSRDGKFVAFLSDRDGHMDVWITQPGSGQFQNLTRGSVPELVNPSVRTLGFSPDGSLVLFWARKPAGASGQISIWAVPALGGQPKLYLEGVAEFDWSQDGSQLTCHTPGPGDPLFISNDSLCPKGRPIFKAPAGLHSHFPLWAADNAFIYFVQGALPDKLDIWRIRPAGGMPERITSHNSRVTHPAWLDRHTLAYLASDPDGSGPWLYSIDVEHRIPHRLTPGPDRYTSLAASADGRRLVVTRASSKGTLWQLRIAGSPAEAASPSQISPSQISPSRISVMPATASSPRLGPDYLIYVSPSGAGEGIWKRANGTDTELWSGRGAQIFGGPAISPDGRSIAFSIRQQSQTLLYVMQVDGTNVRVVADSLELEGSPAWAPNGRSITSAANDHGVPRLFRIPVGGGSPALMFRDYAVDPAWEPGGRFVVYSGPDIGTIFSVKAVTPEGMAHPLPAMTLSRGARHMVFLPNGPALIFLRGAIQHKDLWRMDLPTGVERRLTNLAPDFNIRDFDISPDGRDVVIERVEERSDVVLLDLPRK